MDRLTRHPTFLFAGGGTGGHLFPGIAVAEELLQRLPAARVLFVGTEREIEKTVLQSAGFDHTALSSPPSTLLRRNPWRFTVQYLQACRKAAALIEQRTPAAVIGLGGFASVPVVNAARKQRIPVVLLEQNAVAGRATQRLARHADVICHSFETAGRKGKYRDRAVVTGNPVRSCIAALFHQPQKTPFQAADANPQPRRQNEQQTLLVLGGSQGSVAVNKAMQLAAEQLREELSAWRIVHQCGPHNADEIAACYQRLGISHEIQPFFADLPARYAHADAAVARAGATTLAELACAGLPAVLIPYPNSVKNHQVRNAEIFARSGAATIVPQTSPQTTSQQLAAALTPLLTDPDERSRRTTAMQTHARPEAAERVAVQILHVSGFRPVANSSFRCEPSGVSPRIRSRVEGV